MPNSRSSVGSEGSPPLATDFVALPGSEVPLLGLLSGGRCFERLANEPGGPSRNILRPAVSRASAGSAQSLTRSRSSSCAASVGLADAIARSLSLTSVLLLGVARLRPPRRSPGFEPRGIAVYLRPSSAGGPLRMSRALPSGRIPAHPPRMVTDRFGLSATVRLSWCASMPTDVTTPIGARLYEGLP